MSGETLLLAVNAGSSSLKIAAFRRTPTAPQEVLRIHLDHHGNSAAQVSGDPALVSQLRLPATCDDAQFAVALIAQLPVRAVAHRVVHGGDETRECVLISDTEMARLRALAPLAPLHQPPALAIAGAVAAAQPAMQQYACLDTAFHAGMPAVAREYALPADIRARYPEIHAYGFHGLSCRSVLNSLRAGGELPARLLIAHLGSGASVTAVRNGRSVATSMGFSALEGLMMATRCGRLDAGVLLYLMRAENPGADALENLLYRQSGLLGLSGISADMRVLLASDEPQARLAIDCFVQRVANESGALAVAMGGIDAIAFTGGIGEHQPPLREMILERLHWLNTGLVAHVVACNEEAVMAAATLACASAP